MSYFASIFQNVTPDLDNSSTVNLAAGATFTGIAVATVNFSTLQVVLKATVASGACTCTVYIDQSNDGTNWDVSDEYVYVSNKNFGLTVQSVSSYYRIRVTNNSSTITNVFRLAATLCPIANSLPRSLSQQGLLQVGINSLQDEYGFRGQFSPASALQIAEPYRLCGTTFGTSNDVNFWTADASGTAATATVATGAATVSSGTASAGFAKFNSVQPARFEINNPNKFIGLFRLPTVAVANTIRGWGNINLNGSVAPQNGAYFSVDGSGVLHVNWAAGGTVTSVESGSFNGDVAQYTVDTLLHKYEIIYDLNGIWFSIDDKLIHKAVPTTALLTQVTDNFVTFWTTNTSAAGPATLECYGAAISRIGRSVQSSKTGRISGNAATYNFKIGSGLLNKIIFNNTSGTNVTIYDNTTANSPVLAIITTATAALGVWNIDLPFYTGLTIVTTGNNLDATVVYE
tara:strand:- start:2604 stop:3977 length:1374 start_codon:yes stop_codon:yes gene_type:complete